MMRKLGLLILLLALNFSAYTQTDISRAEALFVYNFSRLIEWPANYKTGPFVIGVVGNSPILNQLKTYTNGKQVGSQPISVKSFKGVSDISTCHILFVPFSDTKNLPAIVPKLANKSTLIVSEKNGAIKNGAGINFIVVGDKLKFELGEGNISKYGIKVSSKLGEMAYKTY